MRDWRKIEAEILDFLEREGLVIRDYTTSHDDHEGSYISDVGRPIVERLARQISERFS